MILIFSVTMGFLRLPMSAFGEAGSISKGWALGLWSISKCKRTPLLCVWVAAGRDGSGWCPWVHFSTMHTYTHLGEGGEQDWLSVGLGKDEMPPPPMHCHFFLSLEGVYILFTFIWILSSNSGQCFQPETASKPFLALYSQPAAHIQEAWWSG